MFVLRERLVMWTYHDRGIVTGRGKDKDKGKGMAMMMNVGLGWRIAGRGGWRLRREP